MATSLIRKINKVDPDDKYAKMIKKRIKNLMVQRPKFKKSEYKGIYEQVSKKKKKLPHVKKQLLVDAVIILSQEQTSSNVGINLLNGLQLTYSLSEAFSKINPNNIFNFMDATNSKFGSPTLPSMNTLPFKSVVTNSITTSSINYSLNIFNQGSEKDEILARPSLLVEDGGKATYFSGNQLILGIQGTQTGTITEKNIGVKLEVSPVFNKDNSIELNVNVARTFLRPATSDTTFEQTAETIKQATHTKVNLHFGETVILSALTESLQTDSKDETPLLGRLPLIKYLFGSRAKSKINNNVLILLTPRPYVSIDTNIYNERIEKQLNKVYHNLIDPGTNTFRILSSTQTLRSIYRPITLTDTLYDPGFLKYATDQEYQMLTEELQ